MTWWDRRQHPSRRALQLPRPVAASRSASQPTQHGTACVPSKLPRQSCQVPWCFAESLVATGARGPHWTSCFASLALTCRHFSPATAPHPPPPSSQVTNQELCVPYFLWGGEESCVRQAVALHGGRGRNALLGNPRNWKHMVACCRRSTLAGHRKWNRKGRGIRSSSGSKPPPPPRDAAMDDVTSDAGDRGGIGTGSYLWGGGPGS